MIRTAFDKLGLTVSQVFTRVNFEIDRYETHVRRVKA